MELVGKSARPLSPAAIIGWSISVQDGEWPLAQAGSCQRMEPANPACRQADGCGLWFVIEVQMHVAQELALLQETQNEPRLACAPVAEGAIKFRSVDGQVLEQARI